MSLESFCTSNNYLCIFQAFLGQKYGYRPIPTFIDRNEFHDLKDVLVKMSVDSSLLDIWYHEDTNAYPITTYVLQPISSILVNFNNKVKSRAM